MQVTYFSDMFEPFIIMQIAAVFTWAFVFLVLFGFFANKFHLKKDPIMQICSRIGSEYSI